MDRVKKRVLANFAALTLVSLLLTLSIYLVNTVLFASNEWVSPTDALFVASGYEGLAQDLVAGDRATPGAPPRIPHRVLMRENCVACHDGPGAREEVRTTHPERWRCRQCHVPVTGGEVFDSSLGAGLTNAE